MAPLFDERDRAVKLMCATLIERRECRTEGRDLRAGPSDYPEFAAFLVEKGTIP